MGRGLRWSLGWAGLLSVVCLWAAACGGDEGGGTTPRGCSLGACVIGTSRCVGGAVVRCVDDGFQCGRDEVEACGDGLVCEAGACVEPTCGADACTPGEVGCADDTTLTVCFEGPDGCGFAEIVACGAGARCEAGSCVGACVDVDGDSFGAGCAAGPDCDDGDASANPQGVEICDSADNNCDGTVDEGFEGLGTPCEVGSGACYASGVLACNAAGSGVECNARPTLPEAGELCGNSEDDDCDGAVDEGFEGLGAECQTGLGVCQAPGIFRCSDDRAGLLCDGTPGDPAGPETCNDEDDDCDGTVDEGFAGLGETCREGVGRCIRNGRMVCNATNDGVECDAEVTLPLDVDLCGNDEDDDCDGTVDEGYPGLGDVCVVGGGACENVGVRICTDDLRSARCSADAGTPGGAELCGNGLDDDCDGDIDEGFEQVGQVCDVGSGACGASGAYVCTANRLSVQCSAQEGSAGDERCDGLDNDCDGAVDEGFPDRMAACSAGQGICRRQGQRVCAIDGSGTVCNVVAGNPAAFEVCGNSSDDDCDGTTDEGFEMRGAACTAGLGICARQGSLICSPTGSALVCNAVPGPDQLEACDGVDNDCDGMTDEGNVCGPPCMTDLQEPNNTRAAATPIANNQVMDATICYHDVDYYRIGDLVGNVAVSINLLFDGTRGDLNVEVYADSELVAFGNQEGSNEELTVVTPRAALYTFAVFHADRDSGVPYRLSLQYGLTCDDDVYELNNDVATAVPFAAGSTIPGVMCGADGTDWYDLGMVLEGAQLTLDVRFTHLNGNLDLYLWREGAQQPVAMARSTDNDELLTFLTPIAGRYFVEVRLNGAAVRTQYTLVYQRADNFCVDDAFDDANLGDATTGAITLPVDKTFPDPIEMIPFLRACEGDLDIYNLGVYQVNQEGVINVIYDGSEGHLVVEVFNAMGRVIAADTGNSDHLQVPFMATSGGTLYARVYPLLGHPAYRISHAPRRWQMCLSDVFESDQFLNWAAPAPYGELVTRRACLRQNNPAMFDYDSFNLGQLQPGDTITALALFTHAEGDIDVFIQYGGSFVASSEGSADNELLSFTATQAGEHTLVILLFSDGAGQSDGNPYRLLIERE